MKGLILNKRMIEVGALIAESTEQKLVGRCKLLKKAFLSGRKQRLLLYGSVGSLATVSHSPSLSKASISRAERLCKVIGILLLQLLTLAATPAEAEPATSAFAPGLACRSAIQAAERAEGVPNGLLDAMGRVESGRPDPMTGVVYPWPWTINVEGIGHIYASKAEAISAVLGFQEQGIRSIDVGCMQINLMQHPDAFASLEQALDPHENVRYAVRFLSELRARVGDWNAAVAAYHSLTPRIGEDYRRRVLAAWSKDGSEDLAFLGTIDAASPAVSPAALKASSMPIGMGAVMLLRGLQHPRIIPMAAGAGGIIPHGRGLDAYRSAPVLLAVHFGSRGRL